MPKPVIMCGPSSEDVSVVPSGTSMMPSSTRTSTKGEPERQAPLSAPWAGATVWGL